MIVTLGLNGSTDQFTFSLLMTAFRQRGGTMGQQGQKLSKAERRSDSAIKKALWDISEPKTVDDAGKEIPLQRDGPDVRPRRLKDGGQSLSMELPEFERLQKFFDSEDLVWNPDIVDVADELSQRLAASLAGAQANG